MTTVALSPASASHATAIESPRVFLPAEWPADPLRFRTEKILWKKMKAR
jgi:hypothetical protein